MFPHTDLEFAVRLQAFKKAFRMKSLRTQAQWFHSEGPMFESSRDHFSPKPACFGLKHLAQLKMRSFTTVYVLIQW